MKIRHPLLLVVLCAAFSGQADELRLLKQIPRESHVVVWWRSTPEQRLLDRHMEKFWEQLSGSGIGEAVIDLIGTTLDIDAAGAAENRLSTVAALFDGIDIHHLGSDGAFGLSLSGGMSAVCLLEPADCVKGYGELTTLLKRVAALAPQWLVMEVKSDTECTLSLEGTSFSVNAVNTGKCIAVGCGGSMFTKSLELIRNPAQRAAGGFWDGPRCRQAASLLPKGEEGMFYIDMAQLCGRFSDALASLAANDSHEGAAFQLMQDIWKRCGIDKTVDFVAGTSWTEGRVMHSYSVAAMQNGWKKTVLGQVLEAAELRSIPFDRIPGEATSAAFQCGMDLDPVVKTVLQVLGSRIGKKELQRFLGEFTEMLGYNPTELISLFSGSQLSFMVRSMKPQLFGNIDQSVVMLSLKDPKKAADIISKLEQSLINAITTNLPGFFSFSKDGSLPGFTTLKSMGMPTGSLGWGVKDGAFYFTTDINVLKQTFEGKNAGGQPFLWKDDLSRIGLFPQGPVYTFSYMDLGRVLNNSAQALSMFGMIAAFLPPDLPHADVMKKVFGLIPRLAVPVRSLDFFGGTVSVSTMDKERGLIITQEAVELRDLPPEKTETPREPAEEKKENGKETIKKF